MEKGGPGGMKGVERNTAEKLREKEGKLRRPELSKQGAN